MASELPKFIANACMRWLKCTCDAKRLMTLGSNNKAVNDRASGCRRPNVRCRAGMHGTKVVHNEAGWSFKGVRAPTHCADGLQRGYKPRLGLAELAELAGPRVAAAAGKVAQHTACVCMQARFRYVPG